MSVQLKETFQAIILEATGAEEASQKEVIQNLWSGYGKILRFELKGAAFESVVVKHVRWPDQGKHPRGWNTDLSHQRKLHSYEVETNWYRDYSDQCDESCRIPSCLALESHEDEVIIVMEDLDAAGFPNRRTSISWDGISACLSWLANFHATFLGVRPEGLWKVGTYWHLDTRPDELDELDDIELKEAAHLIDQKLNEGTFQTFVHGDAKLPNFCFSRNSKQVAAVDFQYVGGGCGMKDVAYFIGSCLYEDDCDKMESRLLDLYFAELKSALKAKNNPVSFNEVETEWRALFPVAWTDFHRFLKGWSPGHWKINGYSERKAREVMLALNNSSK